MSGSTVARATGIGPDEEASSEHPGKRQVDDILADIFQDLSSGWEVRRDLNGGDCGCIVVSTEYQTVVIETDLLPTPKSEQAIRDKHKLDLELKKTTSVIIVRLLDKFIGLSDDKLRTELFKTNNLQYIICDSERYPEGGWITGTIYDLAFTVQTSITSPKEIDEYLGPINSCMKVIKEVVENLNGSEKREIAMTLNQPEDEQTWHMAGLILSNAMVFYDLVADKITLNTGKKCKTLDELRNGSNKITQGRLKSAWTDMLNYNYNPIFSVARKILSILGKSGSEKTIQALDDAAIALRSKTAARSSDMYGKLLQQVIVDRTKLASYYTTPEAATLMATLAVPQPKDPTYKSDNLARYRIADFACGTGLLLSSAYRQLIFNYEISNIGIEKTSPNVLHRTMIEKCLIGLDVLPIATHLAVSALAMIFPMQVFGNTNVKTMPIGKTHEYKKKNKTIPYYRLGSLDLIRNETNATIIQSLETVKGKEDESVERPWTLDESHHNIPDDSCNLIVMNPPFVRSTNDAKKYGGNAVPKYAAFGISKKDQSMMGKLEGKKFAGTCSHGHAGIASNFIAICDKKIHKHGKLALIIPSTVASGKTWKGVRDLLQNNYDIQVVSIANATIKSSKRSFSSDTGMGEVILIAEKREIKKSPRGLFISLRERPSTIMDAAQIGLAIGNLTGVDRLESGYGGTALRIGNTKVGSCLDCPLDNDWKFVNILDPLIEQIAHAIRQNMVPLDKCFKVGPSDRDITGGNKQGPFHSYPIEDNPKYTALWNNVQKQQLCMVVKPDKQLKPRQDASNEHVQKVWKTATRVHINIGPDFTANSLIAAYVKKPTIGGRAWPSIIMEKKYEKPFTVWCNTTMGILEFWSMAGKQQLGRGTTSRTNIQSMPIPDFASMGKETLDKLSDVFDRHAGQKLDRIKNLWKDAVRMSMDDEVAGILGIDMNLSDARLRLCMEPSISGGRPEAALVEEHGRCMENADI